MWVCFHFTFHFAIVEEERYPQRHCEKGENPRVTHRQVPRTRFMHEKTSHWLTHKRARRRRRWWNLVSIVHFITREVKRNIQQDFIREINFTSKSHVWYDIMILRYLLSDYVVCWVEVENEEKRSHHYYQRQHTAHYINNESDPTINCIN